MLIAFQLLQTVGYYGFMHWAAALLQAKGFDYDSALSMQFYASFLAPLGPLLGVWSIERWQRKRTLVALALALAALQLCFGASNLDWLLVLLGAAVIVCSNWFSAVFHAYQAELFPTEARATGVGFTYAWSRVSMGVLNLFMPALIAKEPGAPYLVMASALVGVAVVVGLFGPLTNDRALEEI
jgi:putative MFS transporter